MATSIDPLIIAQSVYSQEIAAQSSIDPTLSFAQVGDSSPAAIAGTPTATAGPTLSDPNAAGWFTVSGAAPTETALTFTTVTLEGDVTQTLAASIAAVQSTQATAKTSSGGGLSPGAKTALGVGIGVGVPGFLIVFIAFFIAYRRRQTKRDFTDRTSGLRQMSEA